MSSLPIRELQNASGADEPSSGVRSISDHDTDHQEYPIDNSPTSPSPSETSQDHDHDHATDVHSETPSDPLDHVSEGSSREHVDWSPTSPLISIQGHFGSSSDGSADTDTNTTSDDPENLLNSIALLPLPKSSPGLLTHAHQQAMANRIKYDQLLPGGSCDPALYTPVFLHDMLMLPGSLATVIGKETPLDILERLTPARLPPYTVVCNHTDPQNPCLVPSNVASSPVATGLLLLGTDRDSRKEIKDHYRPVAKRQVLKVVIEVKVPAPRSQRPEEAEGEVEGDDEGQDEGEDSDYDEGDNDDNDDNDDDYESKNWRLEARWVEAQVFVWRGATEGNERSWELGEAISGSYDGGDREVKLEDMSGVRKGEVGEEAELGNLVLDVDSEWAQPGVFGGGSDIDLFAVEW